MADVNTEDTKYLLPHRGKRSTMLAKDPILHDGEIFFEVPETGVGTGAGKLLMGDGVTRYSELPYFNSGSEAGDGTVKSVNAILPDKYGNVELISVPYAENLIAPDNIQVSEGFIFRTSGGEHDIATGYANLSSLKGACEKDELGAISVAHPTSFVSTGKNQFDKTSMILTGYTINASGAVVADASSYVCYVHAVGGLSNGYTAYDPNSTISRIGYLASIPTTSTTGIVVTVDTDNVTDITNDATHSYITTVNNGYICIACTNIDDLCVHPKWSGTADSDTAAYSTSSITIPTQDKDGNNLPTATYGMPAVQGYYDELNLSNQLYIQRIGYYPYSAENLATVEALDVPYIYDDTYIFYVLTTPIVYRLASTIISTYSVSDFGTEEIVGTTVPMVALTVYGQNLIDKLRRDVLTISQQTLTATEKATVISNIGAVAIDAFNDLEDKVEAHSSYYGTSSTAAATVQKDVVCSDFVLTAGVSIIVKFDNTNTAIAPTMSVNSTTSKPIYYKGTNIAADALQADISYEFVYDGTSYNYVGVITNEVDASVPEYEYETSPAVNDHSIDDKIFYNEKPYTVIVAITSGDTIVTTGAEANVSEDTISSGSLISVVNIPA